MTAEVAVRRLFRVVNGGTPTSDEVNWNGDVLWATPVDLATVDGGNIASTARTLTRAGLSTGSTAVPAGSIVLSTRAPIGYVAETTTEMAFNQGCRGLVPRVELDLRFFRYQLLARRRELVALGQGSTFTELSSDALAAFKLACPPPAEQRRIADFLDTETARIDALIGKKRRMIQLTELRVRNVIGEAVTKGLDPGAATRASGIEWIGHVPRDWQVVKIRHLSRVRRGASPRPIDDPIYFNDDGDYAWVRISDVTEAGRYLFHTQQRLSDLGSSKSVRLEPGELFVSIAATVGKPVITRIRCCIHDGFVYFEDLNLSREFLYFILASGLPYGGLGKLGTQLNLNTDSIGDIHVPVPTPSEQLRIVGYLDAQLARHEQLARKVREQIGLLREHRHGLITAAIAGELHVAKAAA